MLANKYCEDCVLSKRQKLITIRNKTLEINKQYIPSSIKSLLVAESPPTKFSDQSNRYFYASGPIRNGTLFYYVMSVLFKDDMKNYYNYDKKYFLDKFKETFYLIDMVKCPIDKLPKEEKIQTITSCTEYLKRELSSLKFQKVIFIGKSSFKRAKSYLNLSFEPPVIPLPFHSKRNVENFKKKLKRNIEAT